jgi:DNA-directed RNA polymerase subunit RPC12/RpoP
MSDETTLPPCPFCKGDAFVRIDVSLRPTQSRYRVGCDKDSTCHGWYGHSRYYATEAEAIAAWSTRAERTCYVTGSATDGLCTDNPRKYFELSCGHSFTLNGLKTPNYCPNCECKVGERMTYERTGVLYMHGLPGTDYASVAAIEVDGQRFERVKECELEHHDTGWVSCRECNTSWKNDRPRVYRRCPYCGARVRRGN